MNITTLFRPEDHAVLAQVFAHEGVVYGGYLRDIIAGVPPTDIDIVLPDIYFDSFDRWMKKEGYRSEPNTQNETIVYIKEGARTVEAYTVPDDPERTMIGPISEPDFDVNLLTYSDRNGLFDFTNPINSISEILEHISRRVAFAINPKPDRIAKISAKGYKIIWDDEEWLSEQNDYDF